MGLPKFFRLVLIYMARQMNEGDVLQTMAAFNVIDCSDDGLLSFPEFVEMGMSLGFPKQDLMDVFDELDIHMNKHLTYTQFMAGALSPAKLQKEDNSEVIFRIWDLDGDGKLSTEDISKFASYEYPGLMDTAYGRAMIGEFQDRKMDGMSYDKFKSALDQYWE